MNIISVVHNDGLGHSSPWIPSLTPEGIKDSQESYGSLRFRHILDSITMWTSHREICENWSNSETSRRTNF